NGKVMGFLSGLIFTGHSKYLCVPGLNCYSCPGAVGACPLGALQNALAASGTRAPYYVIGIILLFGLILGRTICGFLCPVGLGQELLYKIKTPKLKKSKFTRIFSYLKYLILIALVVAVPLMYAVGSVPVPGFCKYICPAGTFGGAIGLLIHPENADKFSMLGPLFTWKFAVLIVVIVASVFIYRFFCRFFCPLGALYGFFNKIALLGVKLDKNKCTDCGLCIAHCKMDVKRVGDHECINCGECIDVCPAKALSWKGSKLFVRENAVEPVPVEEVKPLNAVLSSRSAAAQVETAPVAVETGSVEPVIVPAEEPAVAAPKKKYGRNFWLQFAAWAAALALLLGAFLYFNVFAEDAKTYKTGNQVGDQCPDFSIAYYGQEGNFTVSEHRGKIMIINYWATWCGPCVNELPDFEKFYQSHSESVEVVAIHGTYITEPNGAEGVRAYLQNVGWDKWGIAFAQDAACEYDGKQFDDTYTLLGGSDGLPMTVILDREGVIVYNREGSVTYETLESVITPLLNAE
ncbi:MAG: 4Fe-4S binding protein, partial [Clostridiales bacterium]|nr:4Fe-4S binding protein [Clostridiales bacterium]